MSIAIVEVEIVQVSGISPDVTANVDASMPALGPFFTAQIGQRFIGRSAALPKGATSFDFGADSRSNRWKVKFRCASQLDSRMAFSLTLWAEKDAEPPASLLRFADELRFDSSSANEFLMRQAAGKAEVAIWISVRPLLASPIRAARGDASSKPATAAVPSTAVPTVQVDITSITGVYEPSSQKAPVEKDSTAIAWRFSKPRAAAYDQDEGGRVYLNRDPASGAWTSTQQCIDLTAEIQVVQGKLPPDAEVFWSVTVPADPIVEHPETRIEALQQLRDPYSETTSKVVPAGPKWPNTLGAVVPAKAWEQISPHTLAGIAPASARTSIVGGVSKVRLHCPNHAGDRFIVEAKVVSAQPLACIEAITGMLTMWHRLDTEYRPIEDAYSLTDAFALLNDSFAPGCVQFDFIELPVRALPTPTYGEANSKGTPRPNNFDSAHDLAYAEGVLEDSVTALCADTSMFPNVGKPGYFSLASVCRSYPLPPPKKDGSNLIWAGEATLHPPPHEFAANGVGVCCRVHPKETIAWVYVSWQKEELEFKAAGTTDGPDGTCVYLWKHDLTPIFDSSDGSQAMFDKHTQYFDLSDYGLTGSVDVRLETAAETSIDGASAWPPGTSQYAGRLAICTWHRVYRDDATNKPRANFAQEVTGTIAHEFGHSIGAPHKCGHWAFRHTGDSCAMNYFSHPMRRNDAFVPGSIGKRGRSFCGLHIAQMRKVIFQDNVFFGPKGW